MLPSTVSIIELIFYQVMPHNLENVILEPFILLLPEIFQFHFQLYPPYPVNTGSFLLSFNKWALPMSLQQMINCTGYRVPTVSSKEQKLCLHRRTMSKGKHFTRASPTSCTRSFLNLFDLSCLLKYHAKSSVQASLSQYNVCVH